MVFFHPPASSSLPVMSWFPLVAAAPGQPHWEGTRDSGALHPTLLLAELLSAMLTSLTHSM